MFNLCCFLVDEYILFSVYMLAYNELHIYNVWTSSVIMIYILLWFNPAYTQINTESMLQKDGVFPYGLVDIFMVIDHHCIIILPSERAISYSCGYANMIHPCLASFSPFFLTLSINNNSTTWEKFINFCLSLKYQTFIVSIFPVLNSYYSIG